MTRRHLVVSAVNFSEGGPLTVLRDSLTAAADTLGPDWEITALVHSADLITDRRIRTIAFPESKRSWLTRLRLEWFGFMRLSRALQPDLWVSLHDITPRVTARRQAVYCHNPSPFHRLRWREARLDPKFLLFNAFYRHLYRAFIRRNHAVVVQQAWLRDAFRKLTGHANIIVAHPAVGASGTAAAAATLRRPASGAPLRLLYPALPRVFKNMETACDAIIALPVRHAGAVELRLTLDGTENAYARYLHRLYGSNSAIRFIGRQTPAAMQAEYAAADLVLFPSRLETWGLPITEAKALGKPLLVADLPYAREAVGTYDNAHFVPADDVAAWTAEIAGAADGRWSPAGQIMEAPDAPFAADWPQLWSLLIKDL